LELVRLFTENLLPVFLAAALGYLLVARTGASVRPLSQVGFNIFSPCLVVKVIAENQVSGASFLRMAGFAVITLGALATLSWLVARRLGLSRTMASAVALAVMLPNAGNFGLSANLLAFGPAALAQASLFFVVSAILSYTAGVLVASAGHAGVGKALRGLVTVPTVWAVPVAFLLVHTGTRLPLPLERTVWLLADATIPTFLIILGMQLHAADRGGGWRALSLAVAMRLGGGLVLSLLVCRGLGLEGAARQAGVFQAAMPTAVICTILATEYDLEPSFVTRVVFVTTVLSPLTLTPLIAYLRK
jgi:hypothetical protein